MHTLYCSMFLPYINYCTEVWGNTYVTNIKPICLLQKKTVRIINNAGFNDHTNELFLTSKIIKFQDLVKFKTATVMYKAKNKLPPANIQYLFDTKEHLSYDLRGKNKFAIKYARTKTMCVSVVGVKIWNTINNNIANAESLQKF